MFTLTPTLCAYLHDPIDFRAGVNGLCGIVEHALNFDPFAPACFVFSNKRLDRIKLLF